MLPARKFDDYVQPSPKPEKPQLTVHQGAGLSLFDCPNQPGNLRLTKPACSTMFKRAQKADLEYEPQLTYCRQCETGSKNANVKVTPLFHRMCVRCERHEVGMRLLSGLLCVSCWNRQAEVLKGRNGRGQAPTRFKPLTVYDYDDSLIIVARNIDEAGRVAERMTGEFTQNKLVSYGLATVAEIAAWWSEVKCWAIRNRKANTYNLK